MLAFLARRTEFAVSNVHSLILRKLNFINVPSSSVSFSQLIAASCSLVVSCLQHLLKLGTPISTNHDFCFSSYPRKPSLIVLTEKLSSPKTCSVVGVRHNVHNVHLLSLKCGQNSCPYQVQRQAEKFGSIKISLFPPLSKCYKG